MAAEGPLPLASPIGACVLHRPSSGKASWISQPWACLVSNSWPSPAPCLTSRRLNCSFSRTLEVLATLVPTPSSPRGASVPEGGPVMVEELPLGEAEVGTEAGLPHGERGLEPRQGHGNAGCGLPAPQ